MEITVKIEGLDQLSEAMALLGSALAVQRGETVDQAVEKLDEVEKMSVPDRDPEIKEKAAKAIEDMAEALTDGEPSSEYTREDVRALFVKKNSTENRAKLKAILDDVGAKNISTIEEKDFDRVMKALGEV